MTHIKDKHDWNFLIVIGIFLMLINGAVLIFMILSNMFVLTIFEICLSLSIAGAVMTLLASFLPDR